MKKGLLIALFIVSFIVMPSQVFADVRITVSKGDASLCSVIATQAQKYEGRYVAITTKKPVQFPQICGTARKTDSLSLT